MEMARIILFTGQIDEMTRFYGEVLGLSFHETEQFLHDHGAPPNVTPEEHLRDLANLDRFRTR